MAEVHVPKRVRVDDNKVDNARGFAHNLHWQASALFLPAVSSDLTCFKTAYIMQHSMMGSLHSLFKYFTANARLQQQYLFRHDDMSTKCLHQNDTTKLQAEAD